MYFISHCVVICCHWHYRSLTSTVHFATFRVIQHFIVFLDPLHFLSSLSFFFCSYSGHYLYYSKGWQAMDVICLRLSFSDIINPLRERGVWTPLWLFADISKTAAPCIFSAQIAINFRPGRSRSGHQVTSSDPTSEKFERSVWLHQLTDHFESSRDWCQ